MKKLAVLASLVCGLAASAFVLTPAAGATVFTDRCSFPVDATLSQKGNPTNPFNFPPDGPYTGGLFGGQVFVTITNLTDPIKSITVSVSGPTFFLDDGSVLFRGTAFFALKPSATGDIPGPGLFITRGPVRLTFPGGPPT